MKAVCQPGPIYDLGDETAEDEVEGPGPRRLESGGVEGGAQGNEERDRKSECGEQAKEAVVVIK
ncbi:MAG: hypothetical protein Q9187_002878 [Circinaria calcarea]